LKSAETLLDNLLQQGKKPSKRMNKMIDITIDSFF